MEPAPFLHEIADGPAGGRAFWLTTDDGTRIRLGVWPAPEGAKGTILMFPGRTEYIEKYGRFARDMAARGYATIAIDWRGQGLADRPAHRRDMGHVVSFDEYREDVAVVRAALDTLDLPQPWFLLGHSMGGAIGLRALHDGLPVRGAIFSAPMWGIRMSGFLKAISGVVLGLSKPLGLDKTFAPTTGPFEPMVFNDNPLTTDRDNFNYMEGQVEKHPELALGGPSMRWVNAALAETGTLLAMEPPNLPMLVLLGSEEAIVESSAVHERAASWPGSRLQIIEGARHEVLMEAPDKRDACLAAITNWCDQLVSAPHRMV
ncbi:alpha/beta hydrolase [Nioella nitratireducens]|uniref:alpha/beta hydrolase n=1 Tax=Nioella nitratireducens TaxID=1287720 RepID=UPI0008FD5AE9|nr:alpha/beta hydrolase [Nioella nitratireducens]